MFERIESKIPGCFEIIFKKLEDKRGSFTKTYHEDIFKAITAEFKVKEEYFTHSSKNVFRGLHFQHPPKALDKLVFCVTGRVTDYLVDLRIGSPMYGQWTSFDLDGNIPKAIFAPVGIAHGFYVHSQEAILQYKVSEVYDSQSDAGISYSSFSFAKDISNAIISDRDAAFVDFDHYKSPFTF